MLTIILFRSPEEQILSVLVKSNLTCLGIHISVVPWPHVSIALFSLRNVGCKTLLASDCHGREWVATKSCHPESLRSVHPHSTIHLRRRIVSHGMTVVEAIHWFDLPKFYSLANCVLCKPEGMIVVRGYQSIQVGPNFDPILKKFLDAALPY